MDIVLTNTGFVFLFGFAMFGLVELLVRGGLRLAACMLGLFPPSVLRAGGSFTEGIQVYMIKEAEV